MTAQDLRASTSYRAALAAFAVIALGAARVHPAHAGTPGATADMAAQQDVTPAPAQDPGVSPAAEANPAADRALERQLRRHRTMDTTLPQAHFAAGHSRQAAATQTGGAFVISDNSIHATTQLAGYQRAPLPDQDREAPAVAENTDPRLRPAFFPRMVAATSSAFMKGSDLDTDAAERQKPSGGLSLNIPMQ